MKPDRYQFHTRARLEETPKRYYVTLDFFHGKKCIFSVPIAKQLLHDMMIDCARMEDAGYKEVLFDVDYEARWTTPCEYTLQSFR